MSGKVYLSKNVYEAANERIKYVFDNFERVYVSFSGGKDSGVMLNLVLDYMRQHKITEKIGVLFVDLEGQYKLTIEYMHRMIDNNADLIEPYWVCLPINLRNAVSVYRPFWCCWEPGFEESWVRELPHGNSVIKNQDFFPFYQYRMEFEEFVPQFGEWFGQGKKTACLVGIRSDESLNRYRTIVSDVKKTLNGRPYTTVLSDTLTNVYPIYDWRVEDIWIGNGKCGWDYNRLYDLFYKAGIPLSKQRICQPYGDDQRIGLNLFRTIEPETWQKVVARVAGANFGNIYAGGRLLGYRTVKLPAGHTWQSYTKYLLATLPHELSEHYWTKFQTFMKHWMTAGSPIPDEFKGNIPEQAYILDQLSMRGKKDKNVMRYREIPDSIDNGFEQKKLAPSWRRMAMCILKNDHLCKSLSFAQTKQQAERQKALMEKYRGIVKGEGL